MNIGSGLFGLGFLMILPFVTIGSLLPTWMFINSLQLLAHLPLINSIMPGNAHYFLSKYLDIVRWHDQDFVESLDEKFNFKEYDVDVGAFHHLLQSCGYEHLTAQNMILIFAGVSLILLIWLIIGLKDLYGYLTKSKRPVLKKRHESWCSNFALRFFYEFFLEFCIVVLINLSVFDFSESSPSFSYVVSILLGILVTGLIVFVFTLMFCKGPYVPGYYKKQTLLTSVWGNRPLNPDFDSYSYLKNNKKKSKKRRGWFKFVVGGKKPNKVGTSPSLNTYDSEVAE